MSLLLFIRTWYKRLLLRNFCHLHHSFRAELRVTGNTGLLPEKCCALPPSMTYNPDIILLCFSLPLLSAAWGDQRNVMTSGCEYISLHMSSQTDLSEPCTDLKQHAHTHTPQLHSFSPIPLIFSLI